MEEQPLNGPLEVRIVPFADGSKKFRYVLNRTDGLIATPKGGWSKWLTTEAALFESRDAAICFADEHGIEVVQ